MTENYISNLNIESQRKVEPEVKVDTRPSQLRWLGVSLLYSVTVFDDIVQYLDYYTALQDVKNLPNYSAIAVIDDTQTSPLC